MTKDEVRAIAKKRMDEELDFYPVLKAMCVEEFDSFLVDVGMVFTNPTFRFVLPKDEMVILQGWAVELEIYGNVFIFKARRCSVLQMIK